MTPCWLDILDTLEALGPMTTAELAEETGRDAEHVGSACTQLAEAGHLDAAPIPAAMYRRHAVRSSLDDRHHAIARGMAPDHGRGRGPDQSSGGVPARGSMGAGYFSVCQGREQG